MERKLAAIFSTDVQGYSRLMGDDEEATIQTLKAYQDIITGLIEQHHGRVVDSPGDNMLAEFASVVDAVTSAVAIQQELKTRNAELEARRRMEFRIGLNVGDVITDEGRLYGDGVNIAARLEGLADPGEICISESVHMQVRNKLPLGYDYIGEQQVKNISNPVPVYKVELETDGSIPPAVSQQPSALRRMKDKGLSHRWSLVVLVSVVMLVGGAGVAVFRTLLQPPAAPVAPVSSPAPLSLPDKPSIAVLPLTNLSGDPEQDYFSDGMTDTLITDLSKISGLFVIARHSTFAYKGTPPSPAQVRRELGVRYLLEGSVQKADDQVRINTQLIDTETGGHVWTERYDRAFENLFVVQDEIIQEIVRALEVKLTAGEHERVYRRNTNNLAAYETWLRGVTYAYRYTPEANAQARQQFERAIELDPQYADAYAKLGMSYGLEWIFQWNSDPQVLDQAFRLVQEALKLDEAPHPHLVMSLVSVWRDRQPERAIAQAKQALALDPNYADAYAILAEMLNYASRPAEAIEAIHKAMRLNPRYPGLYPFYLGWTYSLLGQYEEAIAASKESLTRTPDYLFPYIILAFVYMELGQEEEARAAVAEVVRINPDFSLEVWQQSVPYQDPAVIERIAAALRKAGLE